METLELLRSGQLAGQKRLNLSCGLTEFPVDILGLAESLEILDLSNNHLRTLPDEVAQLKKLRIAFFNNNQFEAFPPVLAACPNLSMISFKGNQISTLGEQVLSPTIRWLILTNNRITALPAGIGKLSHLQKLMLAGNQLQSLPEELAACQNLELIRLAANRLETLPNWLLTLPRLSWLAFGGNPGCLKTAAMTASEPPRSLRSIAATELQLEDCLGQGASGVIYRGIWTPAASASTEPLSSQSVAVKLFKGDITSDGSPLDEMQACMAASGHPHLVKVLGKLSHPIDGKAGLVFAFIPPEYTNLGGPPNLETCTRDTYRADTSFSLPAIIRIARGIAAAVAHLHTRGILHGDLYAHNILINQAGESVLGDFGAAFFYDPMDPVQGPALERLEARAFGCLLEDLLNHRAATVDSDPTAQESLSQLHQLQQACLQPTPAARPRFHIISEHLAKLESR